MADEDQTLPVQAKDRGGFISGDQELRVSGGGGPVRVVPFHRSPFVLGDAPTCDLVLPGLPLVTLHFAQGQFYFQCQEPLSRNGQSEQSGILHPGDTLHLLDYQVQLWSRSAPAIFLQGYTGAFAGQLWLLSPGQHPVGRGKSRDNAIQLDDATISRQHACFTVGEQEAELLCESRTNPVSVNGEAIPPGESCSLHNNDLIELGDLLFRFCDRQEKERDASELLHIRSFGNFEVEVDGKTLSEKAWKTQFVKILMARLALAWGQPILADSLQEMLWPDLAVGQGKRRMYFTVGELRRILRELAGRDFLLRSSASMQLNPDLLGEHDLRSLQRLLRELAGCSPERAPEVFRSVQTRYRGEYLPWCDRPWVEPIRQAIADEVARTCLALLQRLPEPDPLVDVVGRWLLQTDACCQESYRFLMRHHRVVGNPTESVRLFERCTRSLRRELEVEPDMGVMREYYLAKDSL